MTKTEFDPVFKTLCDNLEGTPRQLTLKQKREKYVLFRKRFAGTDHRVFFDAMNAWIAQSNFMPTALQMQEAIDCQESANQEPVIQPVTQRTRNEDGSEKSFRDVIRDCGKPEAIAAWNEYCCKGKNKPIEVGAK